MSSNQAKLDKAIKIKLAEIAAEMNWLNEYFWTCIMFDIPMYPGEQCLNPDDNFFSMPD